MITIAMAAEWNKLTVNQLKAELQQRGLENTGKKADLVSRLEQYVKAEKPEKMNTDDQDIMEQIDEVTKDSGNNGIKAEETMEQDDEVPKSEDATKEGELAENEHEIDENMEDAQCVSNEEATENQEESKQTEGDEGTAVKEAEVMGEGGQGDGKEIEPAEKKEGEDAETKDEEKGEDGTKQEEEKKEQEFYDYTKNATGFILSLDNGRKIVIPNKDVLKSDLLCCNQPKTVWVYPITVDDITSGVLNDFMAKCVHFHITFHESDNDNDKSEKGYAEFIFGSEEEATEMTEVLSEQHEDLTVRQLTLRDKRSEILSDLPMEVLNEGK
ncbi:hypothetical protein LSH36_466g02045 [Paralvinella palmiformis]|uniref:SAP domain-containing protein n=1 Tax=Paralvinella palmiformis TaxID=53620 RepID=A0AAD9JA95_9ANNE|nr:hypothetical protein LSH36_466g02045 [Paralvinella palmiformis]